MGCNGLAQAMTYFLVEYDRRAEHGGVVAKFENDEFDVANAALREREATKPDHVEVVLLVGDSEDALRTTHARYFLTREELASL